MLGNLARAFCSFGTTGASLVEINRFLVLDDMARTCKLCLIFVSHSRSGVCADLGDLTGGRDLFEERLLELIAGLKSVFMRDIPLLVNTTLFKLVVKLNLLFHLDNRFDKCLIPGYLDYLAN